MEHNAVLMEVLFFLMISFPQASAGTPSLQYLYTAITPGIPFPEFTAVGLVDGEQIAYSDSSITEMTPKPEWIKRIDADDPDDWKHQTQEMQRDEETLRQLLATVTKDFNHTEGVHTLQVMYGCELDDDGTTRGYDRYGYDGEDFISLDLNSGTRIAVTPQALITKHKRESTGAEAEYRKNYLEKECVDGLKRHLSYGRDTLERKVRPEVSVFQEYWNSSEVVCHATRFFPKEVNITWQKDGEDVHEDVELRETLPNQDGSFQKRSILKVPAEELQKHNYTCVIQHSSSEEQIVLPVDTDEPEIISCSFEYDEYSGEESVGGRIVVIAAGVVAFLLVVVPVAGILIWKEKKMSEEGWEKQ